jgi:formylglycine-generating enzyme required for sulfatase activity
MWALGLAGAGVSCSPSNELPPLGEVLVSVDTDAPVPRLASRLRVDVYDEAGTWLDSRVEFMATRDDWPGSFSVYIEEDSDARVALLRLRAYDRTRDYRGERFLARPPATDPAIIVEPPTGDGQPRLLRDGVDVTPPTEPMPELTVDRMLQIRLLPGEQRTVHVLLNTACVGTMADLANRTTCVDTEAQRVPVAAETGEDGIVKRRESVGEGPLSQARPCVGEARPESGAPLYDEERCMAGGLFVQGDDAFFAGTAGSEVNIETPTGSVVELGALPERVAVMTPFFLDRHEVTVARWRRALADGFVGVDEALQNNAPIPSEPENDQLPECTFSASDLARESYPLNCVTWEGARAFCQFYGGDLPTEAQWEYAAGRSATGDERTYPWGFAAPSCERAVFARAPGFNGLDQCLHLGFGPQPIEASHLDVSFDEIVGLGGSLSEWMIDSYRSYASACWRSASLINPACWEEAPAVRSKRGASWGASQVFSSPFRDGTKSHFVVSLVGFRCMRWAG